MMPDRVVVSVGGSGHLGVERACIGEESVHRYVRKAGGMVLAIRLDGFEAALEDHMPALELEFIEHRNVRPAAPTIANLHCYSSSSVASRSACS